MKEKNRNNGRKTKTIREQGSKYLLEKEESKNRNHENKEIVEGSVSDYLSYFINKFTK